MNEDQVRKLLLVRAVEAEDAQDEMLTAEDRQHAASVALSGRDATAARAKGAKLSTLEEDFFDRRSDFLLARLVARFPSVGRAIQAARWPAWTGIALPLAAIVLGFATNELSGDRRLNIVAFPLIGALAWNLCVYLLMILRFLRRLSREREAQVGTNPLSGLLGRLAAPFRHRLDMQPVVARALGRFGNDWLRHSSGLAYARASRTLHLSAALLAVGILLGMYIRALGLEYRAGWESTFLDGRSLHRLITLVLTPASWLTGIGLPSERQLEALRWAGPGSGVNAGPWIHLYAATAVIFIIGPRLLLALWNTIVALRLERDFPMPAADDPYIRRLLRSANRISSAVLVVPYSYHVPEQTQAGLHRLFADILGEGARTHVEEPIAYGAEDEWLSTAGHPLGTADVIAVLFNLSATPESENHGALVAGIRKQLAADRSAATLAVLLDEAAYRQRLAGQADAEARLENRRLAWRRVLEPSAVAPIFVDLEGGDARKLAASLDEALSRPVAWTREGAAA